ncbi:hypothetical protein C8F01DRAFT_1088874 [Mycena amicta]|nr:hypothetical protein C8F01DRAFT_1088874 [Mycena amicta]
MPPALSTTTPTLARCIVTNPKHTPTFTEGDLSLPFLRNCKNAAATYARLTKTDPSEVTEALFSSWQDFRIVDYIELNREEFALLPFPAFLDKLCGYFLGLDWASKHRDTILDLRQREDEPFDQYANSVRAANSLIKGQPKCFDDDTLRAQIVATTHAVLKKLIQNKSTELAAHKDIQAWSNAVKTIDEDRRAHRETILLEIEAETRRRVHATQGSGRESKRARVDSSASAPPLASSSGYNRASSSSSAPGSGLPAAKIPYPPKLTQAEHSLLDACFGCTKCRLPWVFHRAADSAPNCTFPSGIDYKPVTQASVNAARATLNVKALSQEQRALLGAKTGPVASVQPAFDKYFTDDDSFETDSETEIGDRSMVLPLPLIQFERLLTTVPI